MIDAFSALRNRTKALVLLVVCGLLATTAVFVGIDDNLPGVLLALLAATAFVLAFAHPWQTARKFIFLFLSSILGFILFVIINILSDSIVQNPTTSFVVKNPLSFIISMVCSAAFIVGAIGSVVMSPILSPTLEWGSWFLWILASVTASSLAITYIFFNGYEMAYGVSASIGGIIGGIVVGFMPWLAQKRQISRAVWWVCTLISSTLTVVALAIVYINHQEYFGIYTFWIITSVLGSTLIALISRGICKRQLISQASWWVWTLAVISILIIGFGIVIFEALNSMQ